MHPGGGSNPDPRTYQIPRYLVDPEHSDFIADIPGKQVGAIAISEQLAKMLDPDDRKHPWEHLEALLGRAKRLSASRNGRGRDDLVEVNRTRQDPRLAAEALYTPRRGREAAGEPDESS